MRIEITTAPNLDTITPALGDEIILRDVSNGDILATTTITDLLTFLSLASKNQTGAFGVFTPGNISNQTIVLDAKAAVAYTISGLRGLKLASGTLTLSVQINGTPVTGLDAISVTTTPQDLTATAANVVSVGGRVTFVITSATTATNLETTLPFTRVLA